MAGNTGLVYMNGKDFPSFYRMIEKMKNVTAATADTTLAFIGSEGRREVGEEEKRLFDFGKTQYKWKEKEGQYVKQQFSTFNPTHGWYKARDGRRMIGFSYENTASYQGKTAKKLLRSGSKGYIYSLIANLWNNTTKPYTKASPAFNEKGSYWRKGIRRHARVGLTASVVQQGMAKAMNRASDDLARKLKEQGLI